MKSSINDLVDLLFPNCCPGCGQPLVAGERHLCNSCELDLPLFALSEQILDRFAGRIKLAEARAYIKFYHGGLAQKLLHSIKYKNNQELGEYLGKMFIAHLQNSGKFGKPDVVIPIPLHKSKLRVRGYNQSEALARGMANALGISVDTTSVIRVKKSETQTKKDRAARWQNVSGIFAVTNDSLNNKHILLVDDVITTGATLEACGQTLLDAGVASLSIAALAAAML